MSASVWEFVRPLLRRVAGMVQRGVVTATADGSKMQGVQVLVGDDVVRGPVEHFEPYGFTSQAQAGAEAIVVNVGASADLPVCIVVADRRYRLKVAPGEVAIWDDQGQAVALRRDGIVIDAAGRPDGIKLVNGATLAAARATDPVAVSTDPADPWLVWFTAINAVVPGCPAVPLPLPPGTPVPPVPPLAKIADGSGVVKIG